MKKNNLVVGVSGGKDSTALCLHLIHNLKYKKSEFKRVFMDTGWEDDGTYQYLDYLESVIGPITRLKADIDIKKHHDDVAYFENKLGYTSPMIRLFFRYENYPRNFMRWCTSSLKLKPLKSYYDSLDFEPCNVVGIRKAESKSRSKMQEFDWSDYLDCEVWRPIINWAEKDVIDIHNKHNVIPNKLYLNGSDRVGCYPCINSNKNEIRNLSKERIELLFEIETRINKIRAKSQKEPCGFFKTKNRNKTLIKDVVDWSQTSYGGKQYFLFDTTEPSCMKWGLCDYNPKT